ncbi:hypothetical protein, partial [Halorubrum ezzemoulense]|uniref:hypothetical protein n=1 Tax=Halorubrum ezzemoulense TaxID=337243 RepID=UPI00232B40D7
SISERSNSDENSTANPDEKRSNMPSKPLSEINNVLHKSVWFVPVSNVSYLGLYNVAPSIAGMRKSGKWMVLLDERILE